MNKLKDRVNKLKDRVNKFRFAGYRIFRMLKGEIAGSKNIVSLIEIYEESISEGKKL